MSWQASLTLAREAAHRRAGDVDLRVWVPGCGDGREAYLLLAAFAHVLGPDETLARVHVCGTDPAPAVVRRAREGRFAPGRVRDLPGDVVARYLPATDDEHEFVEDLRGAISFARNDLGSDRPLRRIDLLDARALGDAVGDDGRGEAPALVASLRPGGLLAATSAPTDHLDLRPVDGSTGLWARDELHDTTTLGTAWRPRAPLRVVVVNEHELFVRGLGVLLESMFGRFLTVVAVSHDRKHALRVVDEELPDLVIVDVTGPRSAGLPGEIRSGHPDVPVLVLTEDPHEAWREVVAGGASGVLPRSASVDELVGPLLAVAEGLSVLPPEAVATLGRGIPPEQLELLDGLDDNELRLWAWVARGMQDNEIADELFVSARTVKRRVGALLRQLGVGRRVEAAELAGRLGLLARLDGTTVVGPRAAHVDA